MTIRWFWMGGWELKKPWGNKKAKTHPKRTPIKMATAIRDPRIDETLSLRPAISLQISVNSFYEKNFPVLGMKWMNEWRVLIDLWIELNRNIWGEVSEPVAKTLVSYFCLWHWMQQRFLNQEKREERWLQSNY